MSDPKMIKEIMETVTIPVMAKARIGHFVECQVHYSPSSSPPLSKCLSNHLPPTNIRTLPHPRSSKPSASTTSTSPKS